MLKYQDGGISKREWSKGSSCTYPINILQVVYYGAQGLPVPTPIHILQVVYYGAQGLPVPTP